MPNLRQQTLFVSANEKAPSHGAGLTKQVYKQFPKRTVICTSSLQVHCKFYKWNLRVKVQVLYNVIYELQLTSHFMYLCSQFLQVLLGVLISVLSLTVILTVVILNLDSSF